MQIGFRSPKRLRTITCAGVATVTVAGMLALGGSAVAAKHGHKPKHHKAHGHLSISKQTWGSAHGQTVDLYTLTNSHGMIVKITNYGGVVQSIWVPDRNGKRKRGRQRNDMNGYLPHPSPPRQQSPHHRRYFYADFTLVPDGGV